jgi:hypothetical protein
MDQAYPDVGMGLLPFMAEKQATSEIDALIESSLTGPLA